VSPQDVKPAASNALLAALPIALLFASGLVALEEDIEVTAANEAALTGTNARQATSLDPVPDALHADSQLLSDLVQEEQLVTCAVHAPWSAATSASLQPASAEASHFGPRGENARLSRTDVLVGTG
jgi:hypothetical protein